MLVAAASGASRPARVLLLLTAVGWLVLELRQNANSRPEATAHDQGSRGVLRITTVIGVVVAIVAPLGDLSQSMIKRHLGLKDMGRLLPGHGGILDRVDGLLFVIPATYFVVKALHLG